MSPDISLEAVEGFFNPSSGSIFVVFQLGEELDNVLGTFTSAVSAYECLLENVPQDKLVVSLADVESLTADNTALICSKQIAAEVRISRSPLDPGDESLAA